MPQLGQISALVQEGLMDVESVNKVLIIILLITKYRLCLYFNLLIKVCVVLCTGHEVVYKLLCSSCCIATRMP